MGRPQVLGGPALLSLSGNISDGTIGNRFVHRCHRTAGQVVDGKWREIRTVACSNRNVKHRGGWSAATGIIGLDYKFEEAPINVTLDWKPELNLISTIAFESSGIGLSIRYTFK